MVFDVLKWPDPRLLEVAAEVPAVTPAIQRLVQGLFATMRVEGGVGLAATQVGMPWRVVVVDCSPRDGEARARALINPRIVERRGTIVWREGCLSLPGITAEVERAERIVVEYLDELGQPQRLETRDLEAVCIQHEVDHLDGRLYVDRLGALERRATLLDYEEARRGAVPVL
ncbi:MAG: peptide deformylase [Myxococcales bacterium]|nr:peptide deformylase [Myxococcales bacterium]